MKAMVAVATPSFGSWDGHSPKVTYRGRGKAALRIPPESPHPGHEKRQRVGWTRASAGRGCPGQGRGPRSGRRLKRSLLFKREPMDWGLQMANKGPVSKIYKELAIL